MRLYKAVCAWLEAHAQQMGHDDASDRDTQLDALVETSHSYTTQPEMHIAHRGQSIDDDDGGAYRLGFQRNR
ncbi:hypothetical protein [Arthrobacter sp. Z1-15]